MKNLIVILGFLIVHNLEAQKVTGYWYGQANVELSGIQNNYLTELIISQKGNKVKGFFGYYFKDVYQSFMVKGKYDPATRQVVINNIPIIFYMTNSTANSVDCMTNFIGTLSVSRVKSTLTGYFVRDKKYTYTCPDLRVAYTLYAEARVEDSIFNDMTSTRSFWKKKTEEPVAQTKSKPKRNTDTSAMSTASVGNDAPIAVASQVSKPMMNTPTFIDPDIARINEEFKKRKQVVNREIEVASDSVRLSFYDNAEVDGDSISVFLNKAIILSHQALSERAFNVYIQLDSTKEINEVSMFAENLGKYPPNTALMVVSDGEKRFEVFLSSDFKGNATVRFHKKKSAATAAK